MEQAIQRSIGHYVVIDEDFVAGEENRLALFLGVADGLEEQVGMGLLQSQIADLIDDEEFRAGEVFDLAGQSWQPKARAAQR